jgi:ATP-dependent DNA ligase
VTAARSVLRPVGYKGVVKPPVTPMLARLERSLPSGCLYEPKWDGFRCIAFRDEDSVDLRSRHDRPLGRYFPEIVTELESVPEPRFVLDGELVVSVDGEFDFDALLARLHPAASRVARLSAETPAVFIAFDLLACDRRSLLDEPFSERRHELEALLSGARSGIVLTPCTDDEEQARKWLVKSRGIDGVVAKDPSCPYLPGKRAMVKIKEEKTADCVVAGFRLFEDRPFPSSLLLGLYDAAGRLHHVGIASSFKEAERECLLPLLSRHVIDIAAHPWRDGFLVEGSAMGRMKGAAARWVPEMGLDWIPIAPELVCEVAYDHFDRDRFRHPARLRRLRPDRPATSCTFEQFPRLPAAHLTESR